MTDPYKLVTDCLEANAYYNGVNANANAVRIFQHATRERMYSVIAEVFLMRAETLTKGVNQ